MRIETLLESGANVSITVTPTDLKEFALSLVAREENKVFSTVKGGQFGLLQVVGH